MFISKALWSWGFVVFGIENLLPSTHFICMWENNGGLEHWVCGVYGVYMFFYVSCMPPTVACYEYIHSHFHVAHKKPKISNVT